MFRLREADRRVEHGGIERAAGERDEDSMDTGARAAQVEAAARHEGDAEDGGESGECDENEPPKISRRRDSSGVPTKM